MLHRLGENVLAEFGLPLEISIAELEHRLLLNLSQQALLAEAHALIGSLGC